MRTKLKRDFVVTHACSLAMCVALLLVFRGCDDEPSLSPAQPTRPVTSVASTATYVGRATCAKCHENEVKEWTGSHHDLAMDPATKTTVLGDFDDKEFTHLGVTSRMFRKDEKFFVHTEGPDGKMGDFEVKYTFGVEPLQQYMVEFPKGRIQCLTIAWDTERDKWYHLYQDEKIPHDDWLHWTKGGQNWNYMCAECHSTDLQKNYDIDTDTYRTTYKEIDVSCEACHGPASEHVEWAERTNTFIGEAYEGHNGLAVHMKVEDNKPQLEVCARCHSRRRIVHPDYHPGKKFDDHFAVELLQENLYHPDGQILDEVYVYGSFMQSKMYHKGVRCSNCHNPHTAELRLEGNQLCLQCHEPPKFDTVEHHRHQVGSKGAQCVECHMTTNTYMVVDDRRDHSFQLPRPDLTIKLGVPNACNKCHKDKTPQWANDAMVEWYGPKRKNDPHFAPVIAAGRRGDREVEDDLIQLVNNPERPAIIRATALSLLSQYNSQNSLTASQRHLHNDDAMIRATAIRNVEQLPPQQVHVLLSPMLEDKVRSVRIEAARVLSRVANERFADRSKPESKRYWDVLDEYRHGQVFLGDQPGAHLNLAVIHENLGEVRKAEASYKKAIDVEKSFVPARLNLATLYAREARNGEAEQLLREAIRYQPEYAQAHYSLGLLLAENPVRLEEAARSLATAARRAPHHSRMQYNYGLAMQRLGKATEAEVGLLGALRIEPRSPDYLNALVVFHTQRQQWKKALPYAERLQALFPNVPDLRVQVEMIRRNASFGGR